MFFLKKKINLDLFYKKYNIFIDQRFNDTKHKTKILKIKEISLTNPTLIILKKNYF